MDGNVTADDKIELQSGSVLEGDIKTKRLVIDEGVFFEGNCKMGSGQATTSHQGEKSWSKSNDKKENQPVSACCQATTSPAANFGPKVSSLKRGAKNELLNGPALVAKGACDRGLADVDFWDSALYIA